MEEPSIETLLEVAAALSWDRQAPASRKLLRATAGVMTHRSIAVFMVLLAIIIVAAWGFNLHYAPWYIALIAVVSFLAGAILVILLMIRHK